MKFSHIQYKVDNLHVAVEDFRKLGFIVEYGKEPSTSTNAFVWFGKEAFLELITMPPFIGGLSWLLGIVYGKGLGKRWKKYATLESGFADIGVEGNTALKASMNNMRCLRKSLIDDGIGCSKIMAESRKNQKGEKVSFSFFAPNGLELPLVVSAYSINQKPDKSCHPNGITGIKWVKVKANPQVQKQYRIMIGDDSHIKFVDGDEFEIISICFEGGNRALDEKYLHGLKVECEE